MRQTRIVLAVLLVSLAARLPAFAQAPVIEYYHVDALGSVRAVTDASGTVVRTQNYHPFGEGVGVAPGGDPMGFTGKPRDGETGLDYFGARYYAQRTGRFTTVDPVMGTELALTDPQRWNRYTYSLNNPSRYVDPDGEMVFLAQLAARFSPYADRAVRLARQSYVWAIRFFNSPTGQEVTQTAVETVIGQSGSSGTVTGNVGRLAKAEFETGMRLAQKLGQSVRVSEHVGAEFVSAAGKTFDALGTREAYTFWNQSQFLKAIDKHLLKSNDFTVIDLTGATGTQIAAIRRHVSSLEKELQDRIIYVGQ